ncbi:MAG: citrate transporter [Pseudobutyrivibrio sp.]|uniref:SLC13 family permease n=1 Tax=Pseudobutyrivibrio sp. TaxID=2014367 RepID=UPI0025F70F8D|nr:SLC13 family permease [Pseudobutyrivibrio sp.]MBQ6461879.1 citrate transporter [Pseudobutyrivibrio sp.]
MRTLKQFVKNEIVLCVAFILATISCFIIVPSKSYLEYIDFRTLSILFSLMITMAGFQKLSVFRQIGEALVNRTKTLRGLVIILVLLSFFSSMFITNDVALLTFVPFSIITLSIANKKDKYIIVIVLETLAANLGSMLTPLGNPQNLYLYSLSNMGLWSFVKLMLPYSLCSLILLMISVEFFIGKEEGKLAKTQANIYQRSKKDKLLIAMYVILFLLSILVVSRVLPYYIGLIIVIITVILFDNSVLRKPDYSLLFTFIFLFIFIGNIKRIPVLSDFLSEIIKVNEVGVAILLSQFISNVPAAILCSGFTKNIVKLIIGTNLGGLGTLIASMASLISFKQYSYIDGADTKRYILVFTVLNVLYLACLYMLHVIFLGN